MYAKLYVRLGVHLKNEITKLFEMEDFESFFAYQL